MKVGILVECGREGLEDVLVRRICDLLSEHTGEPTEIDIVPMDNKELLIRDCGAAVAGTAVSRTSRSTGTSSASSCAETGTSWWSWRRRENRRIK